MSIQYKAQEKVNPRDVTAARRFYMSAIKSGEIGISELAQQISHSTVLTETEISAVITALVHAIPEELQHGRHVKLGDLGTFQVSVHSSGADTAKELSIENLRHLTIMFQPAAKLKKRIASLSIKKIAGNV